MESGTGINLACCRFRLCMSCRVIIYTQYGYNGRVTHIMLRRCKRRNMIVIRYTNTMNRTEAPLEGGLLYLRLDFRRCLRNTLVPGNWARFDSLPMKKSNSR